MQVTTSRTISPQATTNFLHSDFSALTRNLERKGNAARIQPFVNFRGQISVNDIYFPVQMFSMREEGKYTYLQNYPKKLFPKIEIILEEDEKELGLRVKEFKVQPSSNDVEGQISYTRFFLLISEAKKCLLHIKDADISPFNFSFSELSPEEKKELRFWAKLFRKLGFIEKVFPNTKFVIPKEISANEFEQIEILYRGITEGEFSIPTGNSLTIFNYKLTKEDLENLLIPKRKPFSFEFNEDLLVLGRFFPIGKIIFKADKVSIANPRVLKNFTEGESVPSLRLNIFDFQVNHRFEKYLNKERFLRNKLKLEQFKDSLRQEKESEFLINLIDEPLAEIIEKVAIEIVEGILQYNDFPDRFSVLEPKLEENQWRVPIGLTYPNQKPIWLTDAFVDVRTGKVEMKISFDELLKKGKKKAKEAFSIV